MKINRKTIITFFIGLIIGAAITVTVFGVSVRKDIKIKELENKIELLKVTKDSTSFDSTKLVK